MADGKKAAKALKDADKRHYNQVEKYVKVVDGLYTQAVGDLSALAVRIGLPEEDSTFEFPKSKQKEVQKVVKQLAERITATIMVGDRNEWNAACSKFDDFVETVLNTSKLSRKQLAKYEARNLEALSAFQQRKVEGLDLSERVWKTVQPFKDEVELAIDTATGEGKSAAELSRDVRSCLKDPDKLFRRVRDKYGNLHLSKAAKLYHPGQGVYRSSYKNAMRVTRSEINMAYRQSDHMRLQQLDFVVGIQVQTSNNHTCLGKDGKPHAFYDICDELAGKYPKDFKFVGWHPQCRCFATPILKTLDEVEEEIDEDGNYRDMPSANEVKDVPDNFKQYISDNAARIEGWQSIPYYIKDNTERVVPGLCTVTDGQSHASIVSNRQLAAYLLGKDKHYKDVTFDAKTGGLKATHVAHNFDKVGGQYEKAVQEAGFKEGHAVILGSETGTTIGERYTEGLWDGQRFEVMGCETATDNNYLRGLCHCADKWTTEVAILHFPNGGFDKNKMRRAIGRYHGLEKLGDGQYLEFKSVVCIQDGKVVYNEAFKKGAGSSTFVVHPPHISKSGTANVGQKPETTKTKEQLLAEYREKQRLLTLERAKKRHDARTPEQVQAIKKFAEEHKKKTDAIYDEIVKVISAAKAYPTVDASKLRSLIMGKEGVTVMKSGEKALASIEKLKKELSIVKDELAKVNDPLKEFNARVANNGTLYNEVKMFGTQPTEKEIIERLAGGDMTKGSCSSLAFAYAGNKAGLDVLDFRGGSSCATFSNSANIFEIVGKSGGIIAKSTNDFTKASELLKTVVDGKEYYFTCGRHAAIVRKTAAGFEYLELQSGIQNGWKPLTTPELKRRFKGQKSHTSHGIKFETRDCIIDIELLAKNPGFKRMLGYINTNKDKQMKGAAGTIK